ncbi:MAG TPA: cupin domain-containing protein [Gaiella sp.]|nr:cupin domain-containing protein [Gaiella sp.]
MAILIPSGEGEVIRDTSASRVEILSDAEPLNATWSRFAAHRVGADLHIHRQHVDLFYVLDGELTVRLGVGDEPVLVPAGTLAQVPPNVVHGFRNASDADVRYLNFHAPGQRFSDYLRALRAGRELSYDQHDPPEDGGRPTSEAVVGGAEVIAERPGLRVELLADVEEIGISETRGEPGGAAPPQHVHHRHVESFYVLSGELTFTAKGRELHATAGSWVQISPGVPHTFALSGADEVRFLNVHTPSCGYGAFLRGLHEARTEDELAAVRAAFDQEPA